MCVFVSAAIDGGLREARAPTGGNRSPPLCSGYLPTYPTTRGVRCKLAAAAAAVLRGAFVTAPGGERERASAGERARLAASRRGEGSGGRSCG